MFRRAASAAWGALKTLTPKPLLAALPCYSKHIAVCQSYMCQSYNRN